MTFRAPIMIVASSGRYLPVSGHDHGTGRAGGRFVKFLALGLTPEDRTVAERVHAAVTATAPELSPRTWYGMPAYASAEGKIVVCFKNSGKFNTRYSTLEFQDAANLDDGDLWPVSFALHEWSPAVERKIAELIKAAVS
jgi:uncharacterized protein YdhG (YjbR/CyaY superfamily)